MIKVKNSDLNDSSTQAFDNLLEIDLPVSLSWQIAKIGKKIDELLILKKEMVNNLIRKHSLKDDEGNVIPSKDENDTIIPNAVQIADPIAYNKELDELENIENDIDFEPISIKSLEDKNVKPGVLFSLSFIFID